jgi:hypothetical protein
MKIYAGDRTIDGIVVTVDGAPLEQRLDLHAFSDNGFEWTYEGMESTQLALALLADHLHDDQRALSLAQAFMQAVVANLDNTWEMNSIEVQAVVDALSVS